MEVNLADIVSEQAPCLKSLFTRRISFVTCSGYKTLACGLQDLPRRKRYLASRIGQRLEERERRGLIPLESESRATPHGYLTS